MNGPVRTTGLARLFIQYPNVYIHEQLPEVQIYLLGADPGQRAQVVAS
ncbi:MAG TPA: hypothetical protein VLL54_19985 [Pyrinomonadaceae bacterium]|nr:hypothetical protein [Pyrinomonadaceae bacterium]